jgi:8-oxo-dGTP pyrophosphatase MutT (NUDIX family)
MTSHTGDGRSVRPRDAASLILLRPGESGLEVLIGRRSQDARFMPGRYVFPGGRAAASDARPLAGEMGAVASAAFRSLLSLKRAALRETFEETGLVIGRRHRGAESAGDGQPLSPLDEAYRQLGVSPALDLLHLIGRAITPAASPIRFHARFFLADGRFAAGELLRGAELDDLLWHSVEAEPPGKMQNVTRFMLRSAVEAWHNSGPREPPLYWHRGKRALVRHGSPAR